MSAVGPRGPGLGAEGGCRGGASRRLRLGPAPGLNWLAPFWPRFAATGEDRTWAEVEGDGKSTQRK